MASTLKLEIITPDATAYSEDVDMVTLPGVEGQMGVFPQHVPLMTQMVPGEIIVRKDGHDYFLAVGEGLVEIAGDHVAILTDLAIAVEKIDEAKVEEATSTCRSPAQGEALRRRSCVRERVYGPFPGAIARQTPATPLTSHVSISYPIGNKSL